MCFRRNHSDGTPINERNAVPGFFDGGCEGEYLTDRVTHEALNVFKNRNKGQPFFLNIWHYALHDYKEAKSELIKKYEEKIKARGLVPQYRVDAASGAKLLTTETNAVYAAMIESLDQSVGSIVEALKKAGEYENTLFIFYSDNGSTTTDVPCTPLNGGKLSNYKVGVRVPAFMTWVGGAIKGGAEYDHAVYIADIYCTVLEAAGITLPPEHSGDGVSLFPVFEGQRLVPRRFIWYFPYTRLHWAQRANAAIFDEESGLKYLLYFTCESDEVFNVYKDLPEEYNIFGNNKTKENELKQELTEFLRKWYMGIATPPKQYKQGVENHIFNDDYYG